MREWDGGRSEATTGHYGAPYVISALILADCVFLFEDDSSRAVLILSQEECCRPLKLVAQAWLYARVYE